LHKQHHKTSDADPSKKSTIRLSTHFGASLQLQPFQLRVSDVKINFIVKKQKIRMLDKQIRKLTEAISNGWTFYLTKMPQHICEGIIKGTRS
jgi:hypothetical protein